MYTRSFYPEGEEVKPLPENYGGVTFSRDDSPEEAAEVGAFENTENQSERKSIFASLGKLPFLSSLTDLPILSSLKLPRLGTEELILIGAALYLLFSKDGDKECAIILLLLLLVN